MTHPPAHHTGQTPHGNPSPAVPPPPTPVLRCAIWHSGAGELPGELLSSLNRRIGRMSICTNMYAALAEACLIERARRAEIAGGSPAPTSGIVVLVQPRDLGEIPRLIDAINSYAPSVAIWAYDKGANPKLRAVVEDDVLTLSPPHPAPTRPFAARPSHAPSPVQTRPAPNVGPKAKGLNGTGLPHAASPPPSRAAQSRSLLTEEELSMLLTPDSENPHAPIARIPRSPNAPKGGRSA